MTAQTADCQTRQPDHDGSVLRLVNCWASWPRPAFAKPVNLIAKLYLNNFRQSAALRTVCACVSCNACESICARPYSSLRPSCRRFITHAHAQRMHRVNASANSLVMSRTICIIAAVLLGLCLQSECAFVKLEVQLAISDDTFSSFGTIYGHVEENVSNHRHFSA